MQIYVGNLPPEFSDDDLRKLFDPHGKVRAATIVLDRKTGGSQGYGFVDMPVKSEARAAIEVLRGKEIKGSLIRVKALKPGDEFHSHALDIQATRKGNTPSRSPRQFRGDVGYRASGAIRRGGKRGG
jgi:RNA recognition motif-containing protein